MKKPNAHASRARTAGIVSAVTGTGAAVVWALGSAIAPSAPAPVRPPAPPPSAVAPRTQAPPKLSAEELERVHALSFTNIRYRPRPAADLSCIQKEPSVALDPAELALFDKNGFVTSRARPYPSFALGYLTLFKADLPVFVSADAILHAWHRSYDALLVAIERGVFQSSLDQLLGRMRERIDASRAPSEVRAELDTYLTVAHSLLKDDLLTPKHGGSAEQVKDFVGRARSADAAALVGLFGHARVVDFTQWKPRGHYEKHPELIPYFRAMLWLEQVDFRPIETQPDASTRYQADDFRAFVAARETMDEMSLGLWRSIDQLVSFFAGAHDNMTPEGLRRLADDLGAPNIAALQDQPDAAVELAIRRGGYGKQRIMGYPASKNPDAAELPLNASFGLFGQRYSLESHTLTAVTEDRVPGRQTPTGNDVAFSTFGNDFALALAHPSDLSKPQYVQALATMRALADGQDAATWQTSLSSGWVWALRGLSPDLQRPPAAEVTHTEAWARRLLATELASWSELRHDNILYAKQSYSVTILCKYPDAYVDPYPEVFRRLAAQAHLGLDALAHFDRTLLTLEPVKVLEEAGAYFERAKTILERLTAMSEQSAQGRRLSAADLTFVNDMITMHVSDAHVCGGPTTTYDGWYRDLMLGADVTDPDVTVADVHTSGDGVLHVGKELPRRIVVSVDWPDGVRAYTGAVYSYHEVVSAKRLSDSEWAEMSPPDPEWLLPIVAHAVTTAVPDAGAPK
jgi:Protein of unknown function (DUF3160)